MKGNLALFPNDETARPCKQNHPRHYFFICQNSTVFLRWMSYSKMCASVGILFLKQQSSMSTADSTGLFSDGRTCSQGRNRQPRKQGQPGVAKPASTVLASTHTCQSLSGFRLFHQACLLPSFLPINFCVFEGTQGAAISWCRLKKKKMALCRPESQIPFRVL